MGVSGTALRCALVVLLCTAAAHCRPARHFEDGEEVPVFVNTVSPYHNPSETFEFYSLPFCRPDPLQRVKVTLGQAIEGDRFFNSLFKHSFKRPLALTEVCETTLEEEDVAKFKKAIANHYFYEFVSDGLPMHGFVGADADLGDASAKAAGAEADYLFLHLHFTFLYNGDQIIHVNTTADPSRVTLLDSGATAPKTVTFSYSSSWVETDIPAKDRMKLFKPLVLHEMEIHWLSILNSVVLVILLTGLLSLIVLRILKKDMNRYARDEESMDEDVEDEDYGWKLVHGDVFRFPRGSIFLCSLLGVGCQLLLSTTSILGLSMLGVLYPEQSGSIYTSFIVMFALASFLSGFVSSRMYKQMEGEKWAWNIVLAATSFSVPVAGVTAAADIVVRFYGATTALPVLTGLEIFAIWIAVDVPLTIMGGIAGRRTAGTFEAPVRTRIVVREIPSAPFYRQAGFQLLVAGFLPFSAIYTELYYLYGSIWSHSGYYLYGILFIVFIILLIVTASITVSLTYFQLAMEDHRWWWRSFCSGGSTGVFVLAYSLYYFIYRSNMYGVVQTVKFLSFTFVSCYLLFVMLGTVGFVASLLFVRHIYGTLKID